MKNILVKKQFIVGFPYCRTKVRGNINALKKWTNDIKRQTAKIKVIEPCEMRVVFVLPDDRFPNNYPYGPNLDNLLKRFQDALNKTIFSKAPGKDSCIVRLCAEKRKAKNKRTGAWLEIYKYKN